MERRGIILSDVDKEILREVSTDGRVFVRGKIKFASWTFNPFKVNYLADVKNDSPRQ